MTKKHDITDRKTLEMAHKPYDIVSDEKGNIGFIQEVDVSRDLISKQISISYAVNWLVGKNKFAWFSYNELTRHCNMLIKIAESSCQSMGNNEEWVKKLIKI